MLAAYLFTFAACGYKFYIYRMAMPEYKYDMEDSEKNSIEHKIDKQIKRVSFRLESPEV